MLGTSGTPPRLLGYSLAEDGSLTETASTDIFRYQLADLGDVDGDGRADIVTNTTTGSNRFLVYTGRGEGSFDHTATVDGWNFDQLALGDVDGDGRADLVVRATGQPPRVQVYLSRP